MKHLYASFGSIPVLPAIGMLILLAASVPSFGQHQPIISDRPGQANSAFTLENGAWQWQSGFQWAGVNGDQFNQNVLLNENQLRYGVIENVDVAILLNVDQNSSEFLDERLSEAGFSTLGLRLRNHVYDGDGFLSAIGWQFDILFPAVREFSSSGTTAGHWTAMVEFSPGANFGISCNGGIRWSGEVAQPLGNYVVNLNYSMERMSFFVEHFSSQIPDGDWPAFFDAGMTYSLNSSFVLDLFGGYGQFQEENTTFVNLGFTWKWKHSTP